MIEVFSPQFNEVMPVALVKDLLESCNTKFNVPATNGWTMGAHHRPARRVIATGTDQPASVGELRLFTASHLTSFCVGT
ncbi:hypothetical protein [Novosphingobium sediminicola]|uniref:Uncharacterized protein n=1 Tax=Novosphingobium sediminicola TaxID=563162 RepID=A0A7W6CJK9_9SPHN|nr:hypothetical protein [Novosphingobium sediminicola]MBB3957062.1 hypothetical protein [Novosphingobium sediminicola]